MFKWLFNRIAHKEKYHFYEQLSYVISGFVSYFPYNHIDHNKIILVMNAIIKLNRKNIKEHVKVTHRKVSFPCSKCDYKS